MPRVFPLLLILGLVAAACGDGSTDVAGVEEELALLVAAAEDVRGLTFVEEPEIAIVSSGELADRIRRQLEEDLDPDETLVNQHLFELLGMLDGSVDLLQAINDFYSAAIAGYYDNDTGEMVISGDDALTPLVKTTVVHELIHALTDQHFGFAAKLDALVEEKRHQEAAAILALAEGDATYFHIVYMQSLPTSEQVEAVRESLAFDTSVIDSLPPWLAEDVTWPHTAGFAFVDRLVTDLGVSGLNQAYTLLPTTSEHIIHPGSYFTRQPSRPAVLPDVALDGYEVFEEGEWGEWNLELYLLDGVDPGEAIVAATGWGGDEYRIYWNGSDLAFVYLFVGDTPRDAEELATSLARSVTERLAVGSETTADGTILIPEEDFALILRDEATVLFVAADDPLVGSNLASRLQTALAFE